MIIVCEELTHCTEMPNSTDFPYFLREIVLVRAVRFPDQKSQEKTLLDKALKENSIPWRNGIGYSADNASVKMGEVSGVAFIRKSNPNTFINGCLCHRLHLAGEKGAKQLAFSPEDLLIKIFYYLEKSSK